jgi:hypothetical protein
MNRSAIIAGSLAVAALFLAGWEFVVVQRANAKIAETSGDRDRLRGELDNLKARLDAANQRLVQAELQAASLKDDFSRIFSKDRISVPAAGAAGRPQPGFAVGGLRRGPFTFRARTSGLDTTYHALYRRLKFSPTQIEAFKTAMTGARTRFEDFDREAKQKRVGVMDVSMQPLYARVDADLRASLTSQFGAEALPLMERFMETLFLRDTIAQVAVELFYTDAPLTEPQANELVDILAKNMRDPAGRLNSTFADGGAMKAEAVTVLSPRQLEVWNDLIDYLAKTSFNALNPTRR